MENTKIDSKIEICRLCGQVADEMIHIFGGDIPNLDESINKHLPITVKTDDTHPLTSCVVCTNTLLSFDQLVTTCIEAQKCFEELQVSVSNESSPSDEVKEEFMMLPESGNPITQTFGSSNKLKTFCSEEKADHTKKEQNTGTLLLTDMQTNVTVQSTSKQSEEMNTDVCNEQIYYKCATCGKCLLSKYTYKCHMKIHTGERPYVCDLCGKRFRITQGLLRHISQTHAGVKKFGCDLCDRKFATKASALDHRNIHTNERPYVCDTCGKAFKQKASLFVHSRSHSEDLPFACVHCHLKFSTKCLLSRHLTRHTGEKPHECDVCRKTFRIKNDLTRHKLVHSDLKPFKCDLCGLSFRMKRYLKNHMSLNHKSEKIK